MKIIYNLISDIAFLHEENVTHKNLKPENLLLSQDLNLKLIGLGHEG